MISHFLSRGVFLVQLETMHKNGELKTKSNVKVP